MLQLKKLKVTVQNKNIDLEKGSKMIHKVIFELYLFIEEVLSNVFIG